MAIDRFLPFRARPETGVADGAAAFGRSLGKDSALSGGAGFINKAIEARDNRIKTDLLFDRTKQQLARGDQKLQSGEHALKKQKIQEIFLDASSPDATEDQKKFAAALAESLETNPGLASAAGFDPDDFVDPELRFGGVDGVSGGLGAMFPNGIPVGAKRTVKLADGSSVSVPLNPKLNDETTKIIAGAEDVRQSVDEALGLLDSGVLRNKKGESSFLKQLGADVGKQLFIPDGSNLETFTSLINNLKSRIPFAKGGKQLTPFESKLLFRLLDTKGKSDETIKKDIGRFKTEFDRLSEIALGGSVSAKNAPAGNSSSGVPSVGGSFNGEKVVNVKRIS